MYSFGPLSLDINNPPLTLFRSVLYLIRFKGHWCCLLTSSIANLPLLVMFLSWLGEVYGIAICRCNQHMEH